MRKAETTRYLPHSQKVIVYENDRESGVNNRRCMHGIHNAKERNWRKHYVHIYRICTTNIQYYQRERTLDSLVVSSRIPLYY